MEQFLYILNCILCPLNLIGLIVGICLKFNIKTNILSLIGFLATLAIIITHNI